jgi:hypothetical protein
MPHSRKTNRLAFVAILLTALTGLSCLALLATSQWAHTKSKVIYGPSLPSDANLPSSLPAIHARRMKYSSPVRKDHQSPAGINAWTSNGPSTDVHSLAIDPSNPTTVYAGSVGVWKTINCGGNWVQDNALGISVKAIAIDPTKTSTLYAAGNVGVSKSTDAWVTWNKTGLSDADIGSLAIDPKNPSILYAGDDSGVQARIYKTTDGGANWNVAGQLSTFGNIDGLAIDPINTSTIYAALADFGIGNGGVYKSVDGGGNWSRTNLPSGALTVEIDPIHPTTLYAGTELDLLSMTAGVYKSTDGGIVGTQSKRPQYPH